jgi:hypothetical protein
MKSFHFESVNETTPKYKAFSISTLDFKRDSTFEDLTRTNQRMQKLKSERDIEGIQTFQAFVCGSSLTFIQTTKKGDEFFVYAIPTLILGYNNMKSLFNTKTTNIFLKK